MRRITRNRFPILKTADRLYCIIFVDTDYLQIV